MTVVFSSIESLISSIFSMYVQFVLLTTIFIATILVQTLNLT